MINEPDRSNPLAHASVHVPTRSDVDTGVLIIRSVEGVTHTNYLFDPSIHTLIIYHTDTGAVFNARARSEPPQVRAWLDGETFELKRGPSRIWDCSSVYKEKVATWTLINPVNDA